MNATGFATTKIQPPRARSARIERPALDAALGQALRSRRLVLLMAPAGFGKTSALAAQIESLGPGTALAWFSFDEDDDAAHLFAGLAGALEPLDLPWRSAPAALAAQLGEPVLTGVITLVQDNKKRAGALLLLPIYRGGGTPETPEARLP